MHPYVFDSKQIVHGSFTINSYVMLEGKMFIDMYTQQFNNLTALYAIPTHPDCHFQAFAYLNSWS